MRSEKKSSSPNQKRINGGERDNARAAESKKVPYIRKTVQAPTEDQEKENRQSRIHEETDSGDKENNTRAEQIT